MSPGSPGSRMSYSARSSDSRASPRNAAIRRAISSGSPARMKRERLDHCCQRKPAGAMRGSSGLVGSPSGSCGFVEAGGRGVVRGVGVEERRQVLDVAAARGRARSGRRHRPHAPSRSHQSYISKRLLSGPKRDGLMFTMRGLPRQRQHVRHRVDRRVPRDAVADRVEQRLRLVVHVRVLEPRVRERLDHHPVQLGIGLHVHRRALVLALEVERVDRARSRPARRSAPGVHWLVGSSFSFVPG